MPTFSGKMGFKRITTLVAPSQVLHFKIHTRNSVHPQPHCNHKIKNKRGCQQFQAETFHIFTWVAFCFSQTAHGKLLVF